MRKEEFIKGINPVFLKGICHRGLHNGEYSENGLKAFKNALDHHMALELDIHLTKDNDLIVFHDSDMKRMTGKEGIIEDLTVQEIKDNYRLLDGEQIPTLKEVMDLIDEKVPMVIELKVFRKNYKPLANRFKEELKRVRDKKNFMLISFDPRSLYPFAHYGFRRSLLVTNDPKYRWVYNLRFTIESVDLEYTMLEDPKVRKYTAKHFTNVWTVEGKETVDKVIENTDTITFQLMDQSYVENKLTEKNKNYL